MDTNSKRIAEGCGSGGSLGTIFVVLKLCHLINWSWWWVTCPFWGPPVFIATVFAVAAAYFVGVEILKKGK